MMKFNKWKNKVESGAGAATDNSYADHRGFRTHLIFAGKRDPEAASVLGATGSGSSFLRFPPSSRPMSHSNHPFAQAQTQSILESHSDRKGTTESSLQVRDDAFRNKAVINHSNSFKSGGKVPFSGDKVPPQGYTSGGGDTVINMPPGSHDPAPGLNLVLDGLSKDCFIIPAACVERFLPAGLTLPQLQSRSKPNPPGTNPLNVCEVADPQLATIVHLMTPFIPLNQPIDTLSNGSERVQWSLAMELAEKAKLGGQATHGILLTSLEVNSDFPLIALYTVPKLRTDVADFLSTARKDALSIFDPSSTNHCGDNFFYLCREVATIQRPPPEGGVKPSNATGYIVSIFRVFDGDDREKLERNWLYWTGARTLYRHLPKSVGLRRITLHKSAALRGDKLYLLLCECANFLENVNSGAQLLPALRARLCGYTGIYKIAHSF